MPHTEGESDDKVVFINNQGKEIEVLHTAGMDLCFRAPTLEDAETIHKLISDLAKKYYALPFPDVCADSAIALKALYPPTTAPS